MASAVNVDLTGKVILVTGAVGGIGRKLVTRGLMCGASLAAFDINNIIREGFTTHGELLTILGDATKEVVIFDALDQIKRRWGRLDILINNAGKAGSGQVETLALDDWLSVLHTNLTSTFLFSKHSIPLLKLSKGAIVNVSSTTGLTGGSPLSGPAYAAAKAGMIALTKNMARDLAPDGVRVNAVAPGPIDTPMLDRLSAEVVTQLKESIPLGELGTPDDVANLVFFLASAAARHITGVTISLSGGLVMT
jgi:3-oxoacyl-[acyl-carrier protein] reductase